MMLIHKLPGLRSSKSRLASPGTTSTHGRINSIFAAATEYKIGEHLGVDERLQISKPTMHSTFHSCKYCSNVILDATNMTFDQEAGGLPDDVRFDLGVSLRDAIEAAKDGCDFFASWAADIDYSREFNTADTSRIILRYNRTQSSNISKEIRHSFSPMFLKESEPNFPYVRNSESFWLYMHPSMLCQGFSMVPRR